MKASDLLHAEVVDDSGRRLGRIHDLRVFRPSPSSPWQLQAVVVGATGLTHRFGYATGEVRGPVLLAKAAHWLGRRRQFVEWSRVVSYGEGRLVVRAVEQGWGQP